MAETVKPNQNLTYVEVPGGDHDSALWIDVDLDPLEVIDEKSVHPLTGQK